jgi:hypothetical protein
MELCAFGSGHRQSRRRHRATRRSRQSASDAGRCRRISESAAATLLFILPFVVERREPLQKSPPSKRYLFIVSSGNESFHGRCARALSFLSLVACSRICLSS